MVELVIGGSGSGKSEYGENLALSFGKKIYYIATMYPKGEEAKRRIKRHKKLREGKNFNVIECYRDIDKIKVSDTVIIECISNLLNNEYFGHNPKNGEYIVNCIKKIKCDNLIIISNNIFDDGKIYDDFTINYMKELSFINRELAKFSDKVTEVVCGIALEVKK
ncbi:MAG: bifunctional adenosylcobinamide kinase/adenosylcobinamide-phosphate guanylyltransferase [Lachnospirales bacterium]